MSAHPESLPLQTQKPNLLSLPTEISDEIYRNLIPCSIVRIVSLGERRRWICRFVNPGRDHLPSAFYPGFPYWEVMESQPTRLPVGVESPSLSRSCSRIQVLLYDLSFLRTCSQIYAQASRLLYSMNIFEFTLNGSIPLDAIDFAGGFLHSLLPMSRQWMKHLTVEGIQPPLITWGSPIGGTPRTDTEELLFNNFMSSLREFCNLVGEMKLRHLALGFALPCFGRCRKLDDVPWVVTLLGMFRKKDPGARVVVFWTSRTPNLWRWQRTAAKENFLRQLASHWTDTRIADGKRNGLVEGGVVQYI